MRAFPVVIALSTALAATASAQLAVQQPTERLLVLPFQASAADSAGSIALADAVRDRLSAIAKSKVTVVPKAKLCEALAQSGFPCNGLLDDQQAKQLARFLQVHAYLTGDYKKEGSTLTANVHIYDVGSSGMAASYTATNGNPGTAAALAEAVAQRAWAVIRASEPIRDCNSERQRGQFSRARAAANKAIAADSNAVGAWLCIATIFEAQRAPLDSQIAASFHALKGDPCNATAWENVARGYQQKGDTTKMVDAFISQLCAEPRNVSKYLGIAQLLRQQKNYAKADSVLDRGLKAIPGDAQLLDLKLTICTEAGNYRCSSQVFVIKAQRDTALQADSTYLKPAIGAAQQAFDTMGLDFFTAAAVRHFSNNASFKRARATAYEWRSKADSALFMLSEAFKLEPNDVGTSLQIAKLMIERAVFDTAGANRIPKLDTAAARRFREPFVQKVDSARPFLRPGLSSADSMQRLAAAVIMLTGGSKLAQAQAYPGAYIWLDSLLLAIAPKNAADTLGPRHQVRSNGSFWYGLSSVLTLQAQYKLMTEAKGAARCPAGRDVFERLSRTKAALLLGRRVHPPTADQMLGFVRQYEAAKAQVQKAFKCSPPL